MPVQVRLVACDHLPAVRLGAAPDALKRQYGEALGETPEGTELVVDADALPDGGYAFGRSAVEEIAKHLSELGCAVRLDPENVSVVFPGGPRVDAFPIPTNRPRWSVGGGLLEWSRVSSDLDTLSGIPDDS